MKKMEFTVKCVTFIDDENVDKETFDADAKKGFVMAKESITDGLKYLGSDEVEFLSFDVTEVE